MESSILTSPTPGAGSEVAYAVGLDGTEVVVGAPGEDAIAGAVYAIDCTALPCGTPLRIAPADIVAGDAFGTGVGISADTLIATAPGPEPGAAYVYVSDGAGWTQQAKLTPSGGGSGERFGISAALSGDRLAVGADRAGNGSGAVYVFVRNGTVWTQEARFSGSDVVVGDAFGSSVSLDGDTLIVGAPFKRVPGLGNYANGAAYVFTNGAGGWTQQAKITATPNTKGTLFGFSVAVLGDRAVIGAPYALTSQGLAYTFTRSAGTWTQQAQLSAAAGAVGDEFGWSVALGASSVLIGAPFAGQITGAACGATYMFDGTTLDEAGGASVEAPMPNDMTGWSIATSAGRWVTSAPGHLIGSDAHAGAAYWFDPTVTIFHSGFDAPGDCAAVEANGAFQATP